MNTNKILVKNSLVILLGKVFTQLLSFLLLPLYTAYLTTEDYGITDLIFTLTNLMAPVIILQLDAGMFRALIDNRENARREKQIVKSIIIFSIILTLFFCGLFCCISYFYKIAYAEYLLINIVATAFLNLILQYFRGVGDNITYSILCCINGSMVIFFNIILIVVIGLGADGMLLAYISGEVVAVCIGLVIIFKRTKGISAGFSKNDIINTLSYSVPLIFNGISWWVMNASDRIIITTFLTVADNGIYAVANKFSSILFSIYNVFNLAWTEVVTLQNREEKEEAKINIVNSKICEALLIVCVFIISSMFIVYPLLIDSNYNKGYFYVPILIIAVYFNCLGAQLGGILVAKKDSKNIAGTSFVSAISNVVINLLLFRFIGLYAAAFSTLFSYMLMFILRYRKLGRKTISFEPGKYIPIFIILIISLFSYYLNFIVFNFINLFAVLAYIGFRYYKELFSLLYKIKLKVKKI